MELPELPEPRAYWCADVDTKPRLLSSREDVELHIAVLSRLGGRPLSWGDVVLSGLYTADQMRAYAAAAVEAERERIARRLEKYAITATQVHEHGVLDIVASLRTKA